MRAPSGNVRRSLFPGKLLRGFQKKEPPAEIHWYIEGCPAAFDSTIPDIDSSEAQGSVVHSLVSKDEAKAPCLLGQVPNGLGKVVLGHVVPAEPEAIIEGDGAHPRLYPSTATAAEQTALQLTLSGPYVVSCAKNIYQIDSELGKGSFGSVYLATNKDTHGTYAIKSLPITFRGDREADLQEDVSLLKSLDHPHIIKFFEAFKNQGRKFLVMEFCGGGNLKDRLEKVGHFTEAETQPLMRQLLCAVGYLHNSRICHRDLKPDNILLHGPESAGSGNGVLKISDFGFARRFQPQRALKTKLGTMAFCAPEVLKCRYHVPCDLWSCGVTMYLLMCGELPFNGKTEAILEKAVRRGNYGFWAAPWEVANESAKALIRGLLRYNDKERLSAEEALQHLYFRRDTELPVGELESLARRLHAFSHKSPLQKAFAKAGLHPLLITLQPRLDVVCPVTYTDFLAMAADSAHCLEDSVCREAFRILDRDCDGMLSTSDLDGVVAGECSAHSLAITGAGMSFEQFGELMVSCFRSTGMSSMVTGAEGADVCAVTSL
jgi:serine/threonine protein kinase